MANIIILGAGRIGRTIAMDLAEQHNIQALDIDAHKLDALQESNNAIDVRQVDLLSARSIGKAIEPADLVISAVPGDMGYHTLEAIIQNGKNVVDISFFPEEVLQLNELAKQHDVTAIVDMGIAPGMSNLILGYHDIAMNIDSFFCAVGGLPKNPVPPFNYKAPFSPVDVIEEYTRAARLIVAGKPLTKPPLSDIEPIELPKAGSLEAFNTDGLRTLLTTMRHIPNMVEKTLRYPGHAQLIKALAQAGFFNKEPLTEISSFVRPLDVTVNLLNKQWYLEPKEEEFTVMRITICGKENGTAVCYQYDLYDEYDSNTDTTSMARCTGYACNAAASLILEQGYKHEGINPPELIGKIPAHFDFIMNYLNNRGVVFTHSLQHPES
ncbi:MAG: saccharopine dehydrogenase C-terminal domain-containing protein [Gammaproteobacteria bacterium]|jgi:saccharopine dehydrogenase-like NADP-dependent oxidoreductase